MVRLIDPATNHVVQKKVFSAFKGSFPAITPLQIQKSMQLAASSGKPVLNFIRRERRVLLSVAAPCRLSDQVFLMEALMDITGHVFFNDIDLIDDKGLLNEIKRSHIRAVTDDLTGLFNRRYIDERLPLDIRACMEREKPLSVIFADIDYYKRVNDLYGHVAGDSVLREFAALLTRTLCNGKSWIARYGGEEFLIVLKDSEYAKAKQTAERIRTTVMHHAFRHRDHSIRITCSFGVVAINDFSKALSVDDLLSEVDRRLYQAKNQGRNIVV